MTVHSSQTPEFAVAAFEISEEAEEVSIQGTIEHVQSSSEDEVEVLEARAATATAARREAEALERLREAQARRSRGQSSRSSISSARLNNAQPAPPAQPAMPAQPALPSRSDLPAHEPVLPEARHNWLEWLTHNAPVVGTQRARREHDPATAVEPGGSVGVSAEPLGSGGGHAFFEGALTHARAQEALHAEHKREHDDGRGVTAIIDERDWQLHSVQSRVLELEALLAQQREALLMQQRARTPQASPASFATAHGVPAYIHTDARVHVPSDPSSFHESQQEQDSRLSDPLPPPDPPDSSSSSESSSSSQPKKKKKKKSKEPYAMKASTLQLPPHPNALGLPAWKRAMRTAVIASCSRPEKAREFLFEVESESATFEALACDDKARTRTIDARLAEALMRIIKGDLSRRLAVASEAAAMQGALLSGRQILFMLYRDFARDMHHSDAQNYGHLEKLKCGKELRMLDTFMTCWDNLMLQFNKLPQPDHMYQAFLMKVRDIPELADALLLQKRLPWGDEKKTYEELRRAVEQVLEESKQERNRKQLDSLYDTGNVSTALAATPEEKAKMPCFFVRDGKPCPHGKSCPYSHNPAVIERARKAKADKAKGGKGGKAKGGKGKDAKGKGKGACPFFNTPGGCKHGSSCRYLHETAAAAHTAEEPAPKAKAKAGAAPKAAPEAKPKS